MDTIQETFRNAVEKYCREKGIAGWKPRAALIDMDGVLYDSMPWHAKAWRRMMLEEGADIPEEEFFLYEGMTGTATIDLLFRKYLGHPAGAEKARELYARKAQYFVNYGIKKPMPGADRMLRALESANLRRVLVTGSAQSSLLNRLDSDYPGAFAPADRITALDVTRGKPHPEPYLRGLAKAGTYAGETIVIENAPLGVRAGVASGCFTIAVTTGPIPREDFERENASVIFPTMKEFADFLEGPFKTYTI